MNYNRRYNNYSRENERNKRYENYPNRNYHDNRDNRDRQYSATQPNNRQFERQNYNRNRQSFHSQREDELPNSNTVNHHSTYHQNRHHHHNNSPYYSRETDGFSQQQPRRQQRNRYYQNSPPQIHHEQPQQQQPQSMKPKILNQERNEYNQRYSVTKSERIKREIQEFNQKIKQQTNTHPLNSKFENSIKPNPNFYDPINNSNNVNISENSMNESAYSSPMNVNYRKLRNLFDLSDLKVSSSTQQKIEQQQENIKGLFLNSGIVERDQSLGNIQKETRLLQNQLFEISHQVEIRRIEKEEIERRVLLREKELERLNKIKKQIENEDPLRIIHF
ncbi:hypothetical protein M0813_24050 [Anaeramoeba flamelloides]|uniref:Uncharacterized protein n=1 Tax=Anaeramoeba flamelloides TaxID=1746091 RepID=A0ABQ8Y9X2_9EUKA|nr:hypothetical protein M0813_24050 [Anaeramoeba flamelloides]